VTSADGAPRRFKPLWLLAWPVWILLVFASLAAARLLPAGYIRAAVAAPILLMVPGSLTLGAIFSQRRRPQGMVFVCYAALLSAVLSAFASLTLYVLGVPITANSTYWCLLAVSAVLAIVAEARILLGRPEGSHRTGSTNPEPNPFDTASIAQIQAGIRGASFPYAILASAAGIGLLGGGLYVYDHGSHPAPAGYTTMAWAGPEIKGGIPVGSAGTELHFQIVHHQSNTTIFRLGAVWLGTPSRPLAKSLTLRIGPNRTFHGSLFVPPLPNGCTYRIVVSLTAARQIDPLTKQPPTWSINVDVYAPGKSLKTCK
jgi:hypothetical protein